MATKEGRETCEVWLASLAMFPEDTDEMHRWGIFSFPNCFLSRPECRIYS